MYFFFFLKEQFMEEKVATSVSRSVRFLALIILFVVDALWVSAGEITRVGFA